jgi:Zn-dependent metalloprotease
LTGIIALIGATTVTAEGSTGSTDSATIAAAKAAVSSHAKRFGFGAGQSLVVKAVYRDSYGLTVRFDRTYRGLSVLNGDFVVHLDRAGHYEYAEGKRIAGLPSSVRPMVGRAAALSVAAKAVSYRVKAQSSKLAVFGGTRGSVLAWQVATSGFRADQAAMTYVSARTGRTLASWATVQNDGVVPNKRNVGTGNTQYSGTVPLNDIKKKKTYTLTDKTRGGQSIYDAHNTSSQGVGTIFTDSNNVWGNGATTSRETAAADAAYGLANTWDYYLNTYGRDGIANDGRAARGFVHYGSGYRNAFWSDGCFCMEFGDGSGNWGPLTSLDVAGHEMSHGVTSRTAGLIYSGESGGLNESTSDVMGTQVEWYANNASDVPDYMIGEEFQIPFDPENNFLRRMDDPHQDGGSANCWYSGVGNLNVHYSSGVGNHLFYLMAEGSGAKTINGLAYDSPTCDSSTVTGIGHEKAAAIWYQALTHHWVASTNYHSACTGLITSASELYGSTEAAAVTAACHAVSIS